MFRIQKCAMLMGSSVIEYKRVISSAVMFTNKFRSLVDSNVTKRRNLFKGSCTKQEIRSSSVRVHSTGSNVPTDLLKIANTEGSEDEYREFMAVFPDVIQDLTDAVKHLGIPEATKWFEEVLQYNVFSGSHYRGMSAVLTYRMLSPADQLTPENARLANILGWCVVMLEALITMLDDVMDNGTIRKARPCWYRYKNIGVAAAYDGVLVENGIYELLKLNFQDKPYYTALLELFHNVALKSALGQYLDLSSSEFGRKPKLDKFTMTKHATIAKYKTAYCIYYLSIASAMRMAGIQDEEMYRQAETLSIELAHYLTIQDDILDSFGDSEITGETVSDIQVGKCTWPVVVALQNVTPEQRAILEECYGSNNPEHVTAVKELYNRIGILAAHSTFEEEKYKLISTRIQEMSQEMPKKLFFKLLEEAYRKEY